MGNKNESAKSVEGKTTMIFGKKKPEISDKELEKKINEKIDVALETQREKIKVLSNSLEYIECQLSVIQQISSTLKTLEFQGDLSPFVLAYANKTLRDTYAVFEGRTRAELNAMLGRGTDIVYWMPELETDHDKQFLCCSKNTALVILGLRNRGCNGKYRIQQADRLFCHIYSSRKNRNTIFPKPIIIMPDCYFEISQVEGTPPKFDLLGEQFMGV